jgi:HK97 gp10 family phage protein
MDSVDYKFDLAGTEEYINGTVNDRIEMFCEKTVSTAKEIVPVRTGTLRDSISFKLYPRTNEGEIIVEARYAAYVEYGTRKMLPKAYIRPAIQDTEHLLKGDL